MSPPASALDAIPPHRPRGDGVFFAVIAVLSGGYVLLIVSMLVFDAVFAGFAPDKVAAALSEASVWHAAGLSVITCTITGILALWVAVPIGYALSRLSFTGKNLLDAVLDIPIVLPPMVIGLSLLILFQFVPDVIADHIVLEMPGVIVAQFTVAAAFAVRSMRSTFDHIPVRREQVALTLGCSRRQAFFLVVLPEARRGMVTAYTLAWARSLGEFGPVLIFAGTTEFRTQVLTSTVYLEWQAGRLEAALAVSLLMVAMAVLVLVLARFFGERENIL